MPESLPYLLSLCFTNFPQGRVALSIDKGKGFVRICRLGFTMSDQEDFSGASRSFKSMLPIFLQLKCSSSIYGSSIITQSTPIYPR